LKYKSLMLVKSILTFVLLLLLVLWVSCLGNITKFKVSNTYFCTFLCPHACITLS
jgi:hypothetical protein